MIAALFTDFLPIFVIVIGLTYLFQRRRPSNFPPGPLSLPIVGNLHQLGLEPYKAFMELSETYGEVFGIDFGSIRGVVINDHKLIKQVFADNAFAGRPKLRPYIERSGGDHCRGIAFTEGERWTEQRRFIFKTLRDFGFGKKSMETLIQGEISELIGHFRRDAGIPLSTQTRFNAAVLNSLWIIITGERFSQEDESLKALVEILSSSFKESSAAGAFFFFPLLSRLAPELTGYNKFMSSVQPTIALLKTYLEKHAGNHDPDYSRDLIDVYLKEILKTSNQHSSFFEDEGEKNLLISLMDLFMAGAETTSSTLSWTFLLLALHPKVQKKLHEEILDVVGNSRLPSLRDRPNMPFANAVIMEVMRYFPMLPLSIFHSTTEDVTLNGYLLPKDTFIVPNLYGVHRDPKIWGDPDIFRPERFIDESTNRVNLHHEAFMPFSTGKRVCLGETLARDELFLFTTSLFQQFQVTTDSSKPPPTLDYYPGPLCIPKYHELVVLDRFAS